MAALLLVLVSALGGCTTVGPFSTPAELAAASSQDLLEVNTTMRRGYKAPLPKDQGWITYHARIRTELARRFGTGDPHWDNDATRGIVTKGMNANLVRIAWGWSDDREYSVSGTSGSADFWEYAGRATPAVDANTRIDDVVGWEISRRNDAIGYRTTIIFSGGRVSLVQTTGHN